MKNKLSLFSICLVLFLLIGILACAAPQPTPAPTSTPTTTSTTSAQPAKPIELSFNFLGPENTDVPQLCLIPWGKEIEKVTQGRVTIKYYWSSALGPPFESYNLVTKGIADMVWGQFSYTPGKFPISSLAELPYVFDPGDSPRAYAGIITEFYEKAANVEYGDVHVLALTPTSPANIYTTKKPVKSLADLKGLKLRAGGQMPSKIVELLGGTPVSISATDAYEALQKGTVDGSVMNGATVLAYQMHQLVKYMALANLYVPCSYIALNKDSWNKISVADQKSITEISGLHLSELMATAQRTEDEHSVEVFIKMGIQNNPMTPAELENWKKATAPLADSVVADLESKGLPGKQAYSLLMELVKKYSGQ